MQDLYHPSLTFNKSLRKIATTGFFLRLAALIFILTMGKSLSVPYYLRDDAMYETLGLYYIDTAASLVDRAAFARIGASGHMMHFWPWVMCITSYMFKSIYASRFLNIFLSALAIAEVGKLTYSVSYDEKTSLFAAKLFAYLPVTILTCCFPIKDIFLTYAILVFFNALVKVRKEIKITLAELLWIAILVVWVIDTRGGVAEMCLVFLLAAYGIRYYKEKDIAKMLVFIALGLVAVVLFKEDIKEVFQTKIDDYSGYGDLNTTISKIQVRNIKEIYKLPFSYAFAMIQPFTQSYFGTSELSFWAHTIAKLNVSIFPVAIGSMIYVIKKKDDWFYWIITFIMYASIISLSIGISRHYLFLIPVEMINYALFLKDEPKGSQYRMVVALGSILLFLVILFKEVLT